EILSLALLRRKRSRHMCHSSDEVDARRVGNRRIGGGIGRRVTERLSSRPIFIRCISVKYFRYYFLCDGAIEHPFCLAGQRILHRQIGEREQIVRIEQRRKR